MKKQLLLFAFIFSIINAYNQENCDEGWVARMSVNNWTAESYTIDMQIDKNNNIYTLHMLTGANSVNLGENLQITNTYSNQRSAFISKINSDGSFAWGKTLRTTGNQNALEPVGLDVDENGNIYVLGWASQVGNQILYYGDLELPITNFDNGITWLLKIDPNGNLIFFNNFIGGGSTSKMRIDRNNNVYIAAGIYLFKYDSSGNLLLASSLSVGVPDFALDKESNIYFTHSFNSLINIGNTTLTPSFGLSDIFVAKLDNQFNPLWAKKVGSVNGIDLNPRIVTDTLGNSFVNCQTQGGTVIVGNDTITPVPGGNVGTFLFKIDSQGNILWSKTGVNSQSMFIHSASQNGNYYIATRDENYDSLVLYKYDVDGNLVNKRPAFSELPNAQMDYNKLILDKFENAYIIGGFNGDMLFHGNTLIEYFSGFDNYFVTKLPNYGFETIDFNYSTSLLNASFTGQVTGYNSISWDFGDGNTSLDINPNHTYSDTGTYAVTLTAVDSCGNTDKKIKYVVIDGLLNINSNYAGNSTILYPNPTSDYITLSGLNTNQTIHILDINGRLVKTVNNYSSEQSIHVAELTPGYYFLKFENKTYRFVKK